MKPSTWHRFFSAVVCILFFLASSTITPITHAASEGSFLSFVSEPGDYIGQGQSLTFTPNDAQFSSMVSQDQGELAVIVFPPGSFWFLHMAAPSGQQLLPGVYEGATRWPFQGPSQPGLDLSGDGRGCNMLTGRFQVLEAVYGPFGYVERFHATFEQHCEGAVPALYGEVQIINPPPPPPLTLGFTLNREGTVRRMTGNATVGGTITCSTETTAEINGTVTQRANRFVLSTGSFSLSAPCSPTQTVWSAEVFNNGVPFNAGLAQVDVTAGIFDPNYGAYVTEQKSAIVRLTGSKR
jgi:hypothetical protein